MKANLLRFHKISLVKAILAALSAVLVLTAAAHAAITLRHTVTGRTLNLGEALPQDRNTEGMKKFLETGANPYANHPACLLKGKDLFSENCSGCHGAVGEGGMGPSLNDGGWRYPANATDAGLFSTIYGGAQGAMEPKSGVLTLDEILHVMAWVRHLYQGPVDKARWLNADQAKAYKPYKPTAEDEEAMNSAEGCPMMH